MSSYEGSLKYEPPSQLQSMVVAEKSSSSVLLSQREAIRLPVESSAPLVVSKQAMVKSTVSLARKFSAGQPMLGYLKLKVFLLSFRLRYLF